MPEYRMDLPPVMSGLPAIGREMEQIVRSLAEEDDIHRIAARELATEFHKIGTVEEGYDYNWFDEYDRWQSTRNYRTVPSPGDHKVLANEQESIVKVGIYYRSFILGQYIKRIEEGWNTDSLLRGFCELAERMSLDISFGIANFYLKQRKEQPAKEVESPNIVALLEILDHPTMPDDVKREQIRFATSPQHAQGHALTRIVDA